MMTFASYQTQNHCISKLATITPMTQKQLAKVRMSYQESSPSLTVVGVTGAVGQEFLSVHSDGGFPYFSIKMLVSKRSAPEQLSFEGKNTVEELTEDRFNGVDIAPFSDGWSISNNFGTVAVEKEIIVVDKSSPLPAVNPEGISGIKDGIGKFWIANPNCSTINCLGAGSLFLCSAKVTRIVVSPYQENPVAGAASMKELDLQTREVLEGNPRTCKLFPPQYALNLFPHNAPFLENGYNEEEMKMVKETRKIWRGPGNSVTPGAADKSIEPVTDPHTDVIIIMQLPTDMNVIKHAIDILRQNGIDYEVVKPYSKAKLSNKLSQGGRRVVIATDHGGGYFLDIIASYTPAVVIGIPIRTSEVTGAKPEDIGMCPKRPIQLVEANNAIGAAKLALTICAFGYPQARILKKL